MRQHAKYSRADRTRPANELLRPGLPHPNGWFCVGFSREWQPGTVRSRPFMDGEVVIYRTRSGLLRATRPYCPHLGTHLGVGGTVDGEYLVCPFHSFAFSPEGPCVRTPYGPPPKASLSLLPVREANGIVWVWNSHDDTPPDWEVPELTTVGRALSYRTADLAGYPQDIAENAVDFGHLPEVHGVSVLETPPKPTSDGPYYHVEGYVGRPVPLLGTIASRTRLHFVGLGGTHLLFEFPQVGVRASAWLLVTPIGPLRIRWWTVVNAAPNDPPRVLMPLHRLLARPLEQALSHAICLWTHKDVERDLVIFNHRQYLPHPRLNSKEGPIGSLRQWARQFYPPTQPS
ncbi:Rieske 2Fe-2S domain-containing protein [Streptomyces tsukubensis]|nr:MULTISPECIES: Rieske 2Fe-2S domain-containing protein [Streptomyces]